MSGQRDLFMQEGGRAQDIVREADIEGEYRWSLTRSWGKARRVGWVMLNPSTADGEKDDPTLRRVIAFSRRWWFDSAVVVNLYPYRSPSPAELTAWWGGDRGHPVEDVCGAYHRNIEKAVAQLRDCEIFIAAWGAHPMGVERQAEWLSEFAIVSGRQWLWHCLGLTQSGQPVHPLARGKHRVPDDADPQFWRFG